MGHNGNDIADRRKLQTLVSSPRERMSCELKGWLSLAERRDQANLAKALLALANHGGGYVLLGIPRDSGDSIPNSWRSPRKGVSSADDRRASPTAQRTSGSGCFPGLAAVPGASRRDADAAVRGRRRPAWRPRG